MCIRDRLNDKFDCTEWVEGELGVPRVSDALVAFDCRIISTQKIGTHHVCFGEVVEVTLGESGSALVYANRSYGASSKIQTPPFDPNVMPDASRRLKMGCFHTFAPFLVPRLAADLKATHPDLSLELIDGDTRRLTEGLLAGEIDCAFFYFNGHHPGIEVTPFFELEPYVLLSEKNPLAKKSIISPSDLENEAMISVRDPASSKMLEQLFTDVGIEPNIVFRSPSFEMARGMVGHNLGFAILMTKPASSITYDGMAVVAKPIATETKPGRVGLAISEKASSNVMIDHVKAASIRLFQQ